MRKQVWMVALLGCFLSFATQVHADTTVDSSTTTVTTTTTASVVDATATSTPTDTSTSDSDSTSTTPSSQLYDDPPVWKP